MSECKVVKPTEQKVGGLVKLVQKFNPLPIKDACVRYDAAIGKWSVLDKDKNPLQHFEMAIMKNVSFASAEFYTRVGCGGRNDIVGIARGDLYLHKSGSNPTGGRNLSFDHNSGLFIDGQTGAPIKEATELYLMPDRKAMYYED